MERQSPGLTDAIETIAYRLHLDVETNRKMSTETRQALKLVLDSLFAVLKTEEMEELRQDVTDFVESKSYGAQPGKEPQPVYGGIHNMARQRNKPNGLG
jgi:hypothetical protein